ncbi:hypothetical protein [Polynucleobacter sp. AP-Sving-400A-A2]|uniref:hypothetical protein n=1 Tax=Polynucleobacter sp. AP-Sving-400A-A2 TaxID=2081049 RepID=UPI001BFDDD0D|nr:hypothetical protein [Polynucleobacter sp. AP-Sving-400A-A2]QWE13970.1 hypothetical protein C2758_07255 [Polynucleobacter sp. AP-Sving-400A-A2]
MTTQSLQEASDKTGIPVKELKKLMALTYAKGELPRPIAMKNIGFAKSTIQALRNELDPLLKQARKDAQIMVNHAFRLIICNLVVSVLSRHRLSLSGRDKDYTKEATYKKLRFTLRAVNTVTNALIQNRYLVFKKGSKIKQEVNSYEPTKKLELLLLPLIYEIQEEYLGDDEHLIIYKPKLEKKAKKKDKLGLVAVNNPQNPVHSPSQNHTMGRRSYSPELLPDHPDRAGLKRINEYLKDVTYALKSPVKRIFSYEDPMQGGRVYVRLQGLPDRRARVRINTLLNGKPVVEVDLSANHPRMLMALENKKLPANFYDDIAAKSNTSREQVKFLVTRSIGASDRRISLKPDVDEKDWYVTDFILTYPERDAIWSAIESDYPILYSKFFKGNGIYLQGLEGDILMKAMLSLIEQDIPSLPIHDAIYVQRRHKSKAKKALEKAWMAVLDVKFKPAIKIDSCK